MTQRAELQVGKLFRDLDGSIVHLKSIRNEICIWTADAPTSDGAMGGATHVDNFRARFNPVPESSALCGLSSMSAKPPLDFDFAFVLNRFAEMNAQAGQHV